MTQVASKPSTTVRRNSRKDQLTSNDKNGLNQHDSNDQLDDRDDRDLSIIDRDDNDRDDNDRDEQNSRDARNERGEQDRHREGNGRSGSVRRSVRSDSDGDLLERSAEAFKPATANPFEALGPMFDATKVFSTMFEFTTGIVKLQQEAFASLIGATATDTDTDTDGQNTRTSHGDRSGRKPNPSGSRTDSSQSDRWDDERR